MSVNSPPLLAFDGARIRERTIYLLLFLFPIGGVSVGSWFSGIFTLLVLIGLYDLARRRDFSGLWREERIWLWLCAGFFISFVVSGLINGWGDNQTRHLGVDLRYLLVVPLYLLLRQYPEGWRWLLAGILCAAPVLGLHALHDVHVTGLARAQGHYSPNLMGPFAALVAVWLLASWRHWDRMRWLLPLFVLAAMTAVALSGSRGAWLGLVVLMLMWAGLSLRGRWRIGALIASLVLPVAAYLAVPEVSHRIDRAVMEISGYLGHEGRNHEKGLGTAVRFEMWHAGWLVFRDNPIFGVGRGNYYEAVLPYIEQGLLHPGVGDHSHAHNAYIDILMSRGLTGFIIFAGMLFYPLWLFASTYRLSPESALPGMLHIAGLAVFSLTDASVFIKGNFIAIFLLITSVFLLWHLERVRGARTGA